MATAPTAQPAFRIGACRVDPQDNSLSFQQQGVSRTVSLQPKFIEVLAVLARHYPQVVPREQLIAEVWEGNVYVGGKALTNAIWHLRQALIELGDGQKVIETVRKSGYRLGLEPQFDLPPQQAEPLEQLQQRWQRTLRYGRYGAVAMVLMLLTLAIVVVNHLSADAKRTLLTERIHITQQAGAELYPAVSPDGRWLVYGSRAGLRYPSLFLLDRSQPNSHPQRLTSLNSSEIRGIWDHRGEHLYYPSVNEQSGDCQMMSLSLSSYQAKEIGPCYLAPSALSLSQDGRQLAFIWAGEEDSSRGIHLLDLESYQISRLSCQWPQCSHRDRDMQFSPDGRYLAIARRFGNISEDLFLRDLASGEERRLTDGLEDIRGFSWHHDSQRLVFSTEDSGVRNGYLIEIEGGAIQPLGIEGLSYPSFVPGSSELVYANYIKDYQVSELELDPSVRTVPFPLQRVEYSYRNPDFSAVSNRIVYVSNQTGFNELWSSDIDGGEVKQLTDLKRRVAFPRWSHDGRKVAFLAPDDNSEGNKIHVLELASGNISMLATTYVDHRRPSWSWDDQRVFGNTTDGITEFYLDNRPPRNLSSAHMYLGQLISEQQLLFSRTGERGLWMLDLANGDLRQMLSGEQFRERYNWTVTEKGVYFRDLRMGHQLINFWRFSTELVTPVLKLPPGTLPRSGAIAYLPQRHSLLLTQSENYKRDIILLKHRLLL